MAAVTCNAAKCTVTAVGAVRWRDARTITRSRAEPVCLGHDRAFREYVRIHRDPRTVVQFLTLEEYGMYLAREASTVHVGADDVFLRNLFATLQDR